MHDKQEGPRLYRYVGPVEIRRQALHQPSGARLAAIADLERWVRATQQRPAHASLIVATYVVDADGFLRVADRHSEHVACAGGDAVRAAGEIFFLRNQKDWQVSELSNQSTGYCPEPESWSQVEAALARIPLRHPGGFTLICIFRRCSRCGQLNIVKDGVFECGTCGADLPAYWNVDQRRP